MGIKRRYMQEQKVVVRNSSTVTIRKDGKRIVSQTRELPGYIGRKSELIRLARSVLIDNVPVGFRRRPDLFRQFLPKLQRLSRDGGEQYNKACMAFKFAYKPFNPEDYNPQGRGPKLVEQIHKTASGDFKVTSYKARIWYDEKPYEELLSHVS